MVMQTRWRARNQYLAPIRLGNRSRSFGESVERAVDSYLLPSSVRTIAVTASISRVGAAARECLANSKWYWQRHSRSGAG